MFEDFKGQWERALEAAQPAFANIDWDAVIAAIQAETSAVDAALEDNFYGPLESPEEKWTFLRKFSTSPKGLGISESELWSLDSGEWLRLYRDWKQRDKPKGSAGRPFVDQTEPLYNAWLEMGRPRVTTEVVDRLAETFYPEESAKKKNPKERKNLRDKVGNSIRRSIERAAATK